MQWNLQSISVLRAIAILLYPSFQCHCHSTNLRHTLRKRKTHLTTIPINFAP